MHAISRGIPSINCKYVRNRCGRRAKRVEKIGIKTEKLIIIMTHII